MRLQFSIKSSTHYLSFLRRIVSTIGRIKPDINLSHEAATSCALALVEAVNNAIFHAHKGDSDKWIDISVNILDNSIEMEVKDSGPGFDMPEMAIPPVDHVDGRGLFIIKSVMHEVTYRQGSKNVLRMVYYL